MQNVDKCKDCAFFFRRSQHSYDKFGGENCLYECDLADRGKFLRGDEDACEKFVKEGEKIEW